MVGGAQLSFAMSRQLAWGVDYADTRYSTTDASLPGRPLGEMNSRSVRTYLQVWIPLISGRIR